MERLSRRPAHRSYGGLTTEGPATEPVLAPRGLIPGRKTNYKLFACSVAALGVFGIARYYGFLRRDNTLKTNYETIVNSNYGPWRDFSNKRMPQFAKILANESPCGDSFKEAYKCAVFKEDSQCEDKFEGFLTCLNENPIMMRDVKADGNLNWDSQLFLHNLLHEKKGYDDLIASVGPAEEDMDDVFNSYRARELLGPNASEDEVAAFKKKFSEIQEEFWAEVAALKEGEKTDSSRVDELYKTLVKDYSVPSAVWLQVLKDYDLEEFDEKITMGRRKYGHICWLMKMRDRVKQVRDVDLDNVTCGAQFDKMYQCIDKKKYANECADFIDELFFCREHYNKEVWPKAVDLNVQTNANKGTRVFLTPDSSYIKEMERSQEILGLPGSIH